MPPYERLQGAPPIEPTSKKRAAAWAALKNNAEYMARTKRMEEEANNPSATNDKSKGVNRDPQGHLASTLQTFATLCREDMKRDGRNVAAAGKNNESFVDTDDLDDARSQELRLIGAVRDEVAADAVVQSQNGHGDGEEHARYQ